MRRCGANSVWQTLNGLLRAEDTSQTVRTTLTDILAKSLTEMCIYKNTYN